MRKAFSLMLVIFIFPFAIEKNKLSGFQILPKISVKNSKIVDSRDSIFIKKSDSPEFLYVKEKDYEIFKADIENEFLKSDSILKIKEMELSLKSDSVKFWKGILEESTRGIQTNSEFNMEGELIFRLPYWTFGVFAILLSTLIYSSLRFWSLYFQEVSVQEQLRVITQDFDSYKRNTIEKERKLMRDLIDSKNRIEELDGELKR